MKNPKNSVSMVVINNRLRLRFRYQGKRYTLSLGLADTAQNRKLARSKAALIDHDIIYGCLDVTLEKYRPEHLKRPLTSQFSNLSELWRCYVEFKTPQVSPNTVDNQYRAISSHLRRMPFKTTDEAVNVRNWLVNNLSATVARKVLVQLNACCRWAIQSKLLTENPFIGMASEIKIKRQKAIQPFTQAEIEAILDSFQGSRYSPIIKFYFLTGCRTGEARGLTWFHIPSDLSQIYFNQSLSGKYITDTKTHKPRIFPCNNKLKALLQGQKIHTYPNNRVFEPIPLRSLQRAWEIRIKKLVTNGRVTSYRSQYNTRHTFITRCLETGITPQQIAAWVGNSPEIIFKHYGGIIQTSIPPEI